MTKQKKADLIVGLIGLIICILAIIFGEKILYLGSNGIYVFAIGFIMGPVLFVGGFKSFTKH